VTSRNGRKRPPPYASSQNLEHVRPSVELEMRGRDAAEADRRAAADREDVVSLGGGTELRDDP
jgi:hypothetical protein